MPDIRAFGNICISKYINYMWFDVIFKYGWKYVDLKPFFPIFMLFSALTNIKSGICNARHNFKNNQKIGHI